MLPPKRPRAATSLNQNGCGPSRAMLMRVVAVDAVSCCCRSLLTALASPRDRADGQGALAGG
eukprot:1448532-Lingulodinium_polyedra.AAC.1